MEPPHGRPAGSDEDLYAVLVDGTMTEFLKSVGRPSCVAISWTPGARVVVSTVIGSVRQTTELSPMDDDIRSRWVDENGDLRFNPTGWMPTPEDSPLGLASVGFRTEHCGVALEAEVALLGRFCVSRGPIASLQARIPPNAHVPTAQPALILNEAKFIDAPNSADAVERLFGCGAT